MTAAYLQVRIHDSVHLVVMGDIAVQQAKHGGVGVEQINDLGGDGIRHGVVHRIAIRVRRLQQGQELRLRPLRARLGMALNALCEAAENNVSIGDLSDDFRKRAVCALGPEAVTRLGHILGSLAQLVANDFVGAFRVGAKMILLAGRPERQDGKNK